MERKPGTMPVFVAATRLYVHYKFKTHQEFDVNAAVRDDAYAREVLAKMRAVADPRLQALAQRFEVLRFPAPPAPDEPDKPKPIRLRDVLRHG